MTDAISPTLFRRFLGRLERFDIGDGRGDVFFTRYDLLKTRWGSIYLHEFHRGDADRCLHDHPWPFTTIVLRGGYWEEVRIKGPWEVETERLWRPPGYVGRYPATHAHRIDIDPTRPRPWSLVFVGRKVRPWGFWTVAGWMEWVKGQGNPICETTDHEAHP
jgi:hypothetical protein